MTRPHRENMVFLILVLLCLPTTFLDHGLWKMVVNPLPTLWLTWLAARRIRGRLRLLVTVGVACGALGDALLAPVQQQLFLPGTLAFFIGHCCYIAAFTRSATLVRSRRWLALPLGLYAAIMAYQLYGSMAARGELMLFGGVALYIGLLTVTTFVGLARSGSRQIAAGVVVFLISDSHIAFNNLIFTQPTTSLLFSGLATYYLAQYLIVRGGIVETSATS